MKVAILIAVFATVFAADEKQIEIVKQNSEVNADGSFKSSYETSNGIVVEEAGVLKNAGNEETAAEEITGSFQYTAPDGTPVKVTYVANENGFQPTGDHIPQAPAVPPLIARALDWIAAHPEEVKKNAAKP